MGAKQSIGKAGAAARAARRNRYVQRLIEDEDVRRSLLTAYGAVRGAYGRMRNGKAPSRALLHDRKLQRELAAALSALRAASESLSEKPRRRRRFGPARMVLLALTGGVLSLVFSEKLRSKVLDLLFGAEEEFEYSSTTTPVEPVPTASPSSSSQPGPQTPDAQQSGSGASAAQESTSESSDPQSSQGTASQTA